MSAILIGIGLAVLVGVITRSIAASIVTGLFAAFIGWLFLPVLSPSFTETYVYLGTSIAIGGLVSMWVSGPDGSNSESKGIAGFGLLFGGIVIAIVVPLITTIVVTLFNGQAYHTVLSTPVEGNFETDVEQIDQSQIRIVDESLAERRAEELLGAEVGLGSWSEIGEMSIQSVNGHLYWIAPLVPNSFLKWAGHNCMPGYVKVSATNIQDASINLEEYPICYGVSGFYFGNYMPRILWNNGYMTKGITDYTMELDDNGKPWWVVTVYDNTIAMDGSKAVGVVVVDPADGTFKDYSIAEAPTWIDRIQPENIIREQILGWGKYVHGFWNFSHDDVTEPTNGMSLVYSTNGRAEWYTGIQSSGQDQGTQGFILVDTRTGTSVIYRKSGVTEDGAKDAIEGKVANFEGYHATTPILYNYNNEPIFISSIKDVNGNFKSIGVISAQNRAIVVVADTIQDALRQFSSALRTQGLSSSTDTGAVSEIFSGQVSRIGSETVAGETHWYIVLSSQPKIAFLVPTDLPIPVVPLTRINDTVHIKAIDTGNSVLSAEEIKNDTLGDMQRSENEIKAAISNQKVLKKDIKKKTDSNIRAKLGNMTDDEKEDLLRSLSK